MLNKAVFIVLAGIPYSGKTTFRREYLADFETISLDEQLFKKASLEEKTYSEIWTKYAKECTGELEKLQQNLKELNVVYDAHNLTAKKRRKLLEDYANDRWKVCIYFPIPDEEEFANRVLSRPQQTLSPNIIKNFTDMYVHPTLEEGFNAIYTPDQFIEEVKKLRKAE